MTLIETDFFSFGFGGGMTAEGRLTRMPFMWVWLRLTIMKLASRKNMMSINGMISMRACFFGIGEATLMDVLVGSARHCERNWDLHFRYGAGLKLPPFEGAGSRLIQKIIS